MLPTPQQIQDFSAAKTPDKRQRLVDRLLETDGYARNWARYWRDVIFTRATNQRAARVQPRFEIRRDGVPENPHRWINRRVSGRR